MKANHAEACHKRNANMKALDVLNRLSFEAKKIKYPSVSEECIPRTIYKDKTANELTKCIIDFLNFKQHQAERINSTGRIIDTRSSYIDIIGRSRTIGSVKWIKGTSTTGTADISATIAGKSVKIEVKIGNDKQSEAQRKYQSMIQRAGGFYVIAKTFQEFYDWYTEKFES
jgi:hypothetical protein